MYKRQELDSTSAKLPPLQSFSKLDRDKCFTIAVLNDFLKDADPAIAKAYEETIKILEKSGHTILPATMLDTSLHISTYYIICTAEASSNLARFDGVRYGYRAKDYGDIQDMIKKSRNEGFGDEPKRRILIGTYVLSHGYYDAYYLKAQKVRRLISQEFDVAFQKVDAIISPVSTSTAYDFGSKSDPVSAYLGDLYTVPASLAGLPCMSMPCGVHSNGRPIGVQLTCARFQEAKMLGIAHAWQSVTDWHQRHPNGF